MNQITDDDREILSLLARKISAPLSDYLDRIRLLDKKIGLNASIDLIDIENSNLMLLEKIYNRFRDILLIKEQNELKVNQEDILRFLRPRKPSKKQLIKENKVRLEKENNEIIIAVSTLFSEEYISGFKNNYRYNIGYKEKTNLRGQIWYYLKYYMMYTCFSSRRDFDKAWKRLLRSGEIKYS